VTDDVVDVVLELEDVVDTAAVVGDELQEGRKARSATAPISSPAVVIRCDEVRRC
jgi:hypothetical protein